MKKICIISALHLSSNPRVWKEAHSLAKAGYKVVILTIFTSAEKLQEDALLLKTSSIEYKGVIDLVQDKTSLLTKYRYKIESKIARWIKAFFHFDNPRLLGYAPTKMFESALKENADLYIAHVEYGFFVGKKLVEHKRKVAFDFEDWYSQDYLVPTRPVKLLQNLEMFALSNGAFCSCPSKSMADALVKKYKTRTHVSVIYNGFSVEENVSSTSSNHSSLVWFSQTIGEGRGLETLLKSLEILDTPVQLNLIGNCVKGYDDHLKSIFPYHKKHEIIFHPAVPHHDLLPMLSHYNIGLAIENDFPENKNTTVSNKILQYTQAGIKTLATNTAGQSEVATYFPNAIELVPVNNPQAWANAIQKLLDYKLINQQQQVKKFEEVFSWEAQEKKLLQSVARALQ